MHTHRARALAKMARVPETLAAVGTADDHFAHTDPTNDPALVARYNANLYAGITGRALADLAMHGHDPAPATDRLNAAATDPATGCARFRVTTQMTLASLTMATGNPVEAAALGTAALDAAGAIRSRQVIDDLRELARRTTRHPRVDEVAALRQRITTVVLTS